MNTQNLKSKIKSSYGEIAKSTEQVGCCSPVSACCIADVNTGYMTEDYTHVKGYQKEADLSLGCGLPTEIAGIQVGDTVVDLGSGAGNDVFIARSIVGDTGRVIGVDMTPEMVYRAQENSHKFGFKNVEFVLGEIENMETIPSHTADVVISNCVMNLVPHKEKAFREVYRILKPGGHFSISDIVSIGNLPQGIAEASDLFVGCIGGASEKGAYLGIIKSVGFKNIQIKKERLIDLPEKLLLKYLTPEEYTGLKRSKSGIYSITIYAEKLEEGDCCKSLEDGCCQ